MNDAVALRSIGQIAVPVTDIERAVGFYRDTLGMRLLFRAPPSLAFFDLDGVRLMLDGPAAAHAGTGSVIYYNVADLDAAYESLSARGVSFEREPHLVAKLPGHDLWMAFLRDPDGNLLALMATR